MIPDLRQSVFRYKIFSREPVPKFSRSQNIFPMDRLKLSPDVSV